MGNSHSNDYRRVWSPYFRNLKRLPWPRSYISSCRPEPTRGADRIRGDGDGKGVGGNRGGVENAAHKKNGFRSQLSGGSTASPSHTTMVGVAGGGGVIATAGMLKVWKRIFWSHPDLTSFVQGACRGGAVQLPGQRVWRHDFQQRRPDGDCGRHWSRLVLACSYARHHFVFS